MANEATAYRVLADAIAALFGPMVEVAVHDLEADTLAYIAGAMSPREIGDPSGLRALGRPGPEGFIGPYEKTNWDGRRLRSISVLLPGEPAAMLCINADVSRFEALRDTIDAILQSAKPMFAGEAGPLLRHDWHETLNRHVASWCKERGYDPRSLDRDQRRALVRSIFEAGGFEAPRAVPYVASLLDLSRATIYNEIAAVRKAVLAA